VESKKNLSEHLIRTGDKRAFEMFYRKHFKSLIIYLRMFSKDPELAKDIAQQSFVKLWIKRSVIPKEVSLKRYLFGIAKNNFMDQYRNRKREIKMLDEIKVQAIQNYSTEQGEPFAHKVTLLKCAIDELPEKCREILLMSKIEGLSYKQIAQRLNISVKTVESQMRIAYKKIRVRIKAMENTAD